MEYEICHTEPKVFTKTIGGKFKKPLGKDALFKIGRASRMLDDSDLLIEDIDVRITGFQFVQRPADNEDQASMKDAHRDWIVTYGESGYMKKKPQRLLYNHSMIIMRIGSDDADDKNRFKVKLTRKGTFQYHGRMNDQQLRLILTALVEFLRYVFNRTYELDDIKVNIMISNFRIFAQNEEGNYPVTIIREKLNRFLRSMNIKSSFDQDRFHGVIVKYDCIKNIDPHNYNHCTMKIYRSGSCVCDASSYDRIVETVDAIMSIIADPTVWKRFIIIGSK